MTRLTAVVLALAGLALACTACSSTSACKPESISVTGEFKTTASAFTFETATATIIHRRDVDEYEDGIITSVKLDLGRVGGCLFSLTARGCLDGGTVLPIRQVSFNVDALCPGFPAALEGLYTGGGEGVALGTLQLDVPIVPGSNVEIACFSGSMTVALAGSLNAAATGESLELLESPFVVSGDFVSTGDYAAAPECSTVISTDYGGRQDASGQNVGDAGDVADGQPSPMITLTVECPDCTEDATVKLLASAGWELGNPQFVHFYHSVEFPISDELPEALDPAGLPVPWPEGTMTFQAYQDTQPGGNLPEEGEPLSALLTIDLVTGHLNSVALELDPSGNTAITCTPGEEVCVSLLVAGKCNEQGTAYDKTDCLKGKACNEVAGACQEVVCVPSSVECAGGTSYHKCLASGTGWSDQVDCDPGQVCINGSCMKEECLSEVVLLVDTSQSMAFHWEAVGSSIQKLMALSPMAVFGMATFPTANTICEVPSQPQLEMDSGQSAEAAQWFEKNTPFGQTPLLQALTDMQQMLPTMFSGATGTLILLSDGADTCAHATILDPTEHEAAVIADLAATTKCLHDDFGIRTYVVGYQYQGNPDQLITIAQNGGAGKESYTPAGSEEELTSVLVAIVEDLKTCFE